MKKYLFVFSLLYIISCKENNRDKIGKTTSVIKDSSATTAETRTTLIENFRAFRNAVYQKHKKEVEQFVDFPIMNKNNEIWNLVKWNDNEPALDSIKPFTEKDFDKYFDSIFPRQFVKVLLKIKSEELFTEGSSGTDYINEGNTSYRIDATFDKSSGSLTLNFFSTSSGKDENAGDQIDWESSIEYEFSVFRNGQIKFKQIRLAG